MKRVGLSFGLYLGLFTCLALPMPLDAGSNVVTANQVNGTWKSQDGEFKVLALGNQRLQIEYFGVNSRGHIGEGKGVAHIEGDTARFKPKGAEKECEIKLRFVDSQLIVRQKGFCGFGMGVMADGSYKKTSATRPTRIFK